MGSNSKLKALHHIVNEFIVNANKSENELLVYRQMNDAEWVDREVAIYVLRDDVLDQIEVYKLRVLLFHFANFTSTSTNLRATFQQIADLIEYQLNIDHGKLDRQKKLCEIVWWMLRKCKILLSPKVYNRMLTYFTELINQCKDNESLGYVFSSFTNTLFGQCESFLLLELIDFFESNLNCTKSIKHVNLSYLLDCVLDYHENSLSQETRNRIFGFYSKLIEHCATKSTSEETIKQLLFKLAKMLFKNVACRDDLLADWTSVSNVTSMRALQDALQKLIDLMQKQLEKTGTQWDAHEQSCRILKDLLGECKHALTRQTCEKMFEYFVKIIETCADAEAYESAWLALAQLPFDKLETCNFKFYKYQTSLIKSISTSKNQLLGQQRNNKHLDVCHVIYGVLKSCANLSNKEILNIFVDRFRIALTEFWYHECQSLLLILIDLVENKLNDAKCRHILCRVMEESLRKRWHTNPDPFSHQTREQIFHYLIKIIETCDQGQTIETAWSALRFFPFSKHPSSLLQLMDSLKNHLNSETPKYDRNKTGKKLYHILDDTLKKCEDSSGSQICERMLCSLVKLIERRELKETINSIWDKLKLFKFQYMESALVQILHSLLKNLQSTQHDWRTHRNWCYVIDKLLFQNSNLFNQTFLTLLLDYVMKLIEMCEHNGTINWAYNVLKQLKSHHIESSLVQAQHSLTHNLQSPQCNWRIHRNWCWVISKIHFGHANLFNQNLMNNLFDYFVEFFSHCNHMSTVLFIILTIEQFCMKRMWRDEQMKSLKDKLLGHRYYDAGGALPHNVDDFDRYQVDWCVRWCVNNVMESDDGTASELSLLKLSQDGFEVRNDNKTIAIHENDKRDEYYQPTVSYPVRSSFAVSCGVYYYEVTIVTSGEMMFGWGTREARVDFEDEENDIGNDKHSIGFDASRKLIVHNAQEFTYPDLPDCLAGDVIGCLIDCDARRFVFYYRGHELELVGGENVETNNVSHKISFFSSSYYPFACLPSPHQQCHFNFGQSPFKFALEDITFRHFHEASGGDGRRYRLTETVRIENVYFDKPNLDGPSPFKINNNHWFKHSPVDNQVDLFYWDDIQNKIDEKVKSAEDDIRSDRDDLEDSSIENMKIDKQFVCARFIQSFIEVMGDDVVDANVATLSTIDVIEDNKVDLLALMIGTIIFTYIDGANKTKLLELIYPYLQLRINTSVDSAKHRYICIVLLKLIMFSHSYGYNFFDYIRSEIFAYLTRTLGQTNDKWTQMFVFIALENLNLSQEEKQMLLENNEIMALLKEWQQHIDTRKIDFNNYTLLPHQLHFTSQHFLCRVLNLVPVPQPKPTALNLNDRTEYLKLSLDLLSARSDWHSSDEWQSVRSCCQASKGIYYFEVVLLTNGPMRIGWSTKRNEIVSTEVGGDMFSIGFDGCFRGIWHNDREIHIESCVKRWKARDVVGCLLEVIRNIKNNEKVKLFSFYLNGNLINYKTVEPIYSSPHPYHPAISLSPHQQVYFNFGQTPFKYPPQKDYLNFYDYPQVSNHKSSINLSNSNIINSVVCIESTNNFRNISLSYQNVQIDEILKKGLTFDCITCPKCHKEILIKHLMFHCCACLKPSKKTATGNQLITIPSTAANLLANKQRLVKEDPAYTSKQIKLNITNDYETSTKPLVKCELCHKPMSTKRVRFECCDHLKFCLECGLHLDDCPKCKNNVPSTLSSQSHDQQPITECQLCGKIILTRPLQFVDCDHGKICRVCVNKMLDCPKC